MLHQAWTRKNASTNRVDQSRNELRNWAGRAHHEERLEFAELVAGHERHGCGPRSARPPRQGVDPRGLVRRGRPAEQAFDLRATEAAETGGDVLRKGSSSSRAVRVVQIEQLLGGQVLLGLGQVGALAR